MTPNPFGLTDRDILIIWAWATGHTTDWLADLYGWNRSTIKSATRTLFLKLRVNTKPQATAMVLREVLRSQPEQTPRPNTITFERMIAGAHKAIDDGADPMLILSYLIWPPPALAHRLAA